MHRFARFPILMAAIGGLVLPVPLMAQAPGAGIYTLVLPAGGFGSNQFTDALVNTLAGAAKFCGSLNKTYQVDCLAERIEALAEEIPADSDYEEVRGVLQDTANKMESLARSNRDRAQPRQRVSSGGSTPITTTRVLTPVRPDAVDTVNQQAAAILEEAETVLLRAPNDQRGKKAQYARIADAIGSNKALLRSA